MNFSGSLKLKIGVLAPNSNFVPYLASDMLTALEFALAEARLNAELIIGSAGYNADVKMIIPAIQQLILAQRVNCIVAPLNVAMIDEVAGYCESQAVPLIALNLTEDPLFESSRNSYVFVNSFYLWHSAWMSGYVATQKFGLKSAGISALHDGGYGLMFAFQLGLEAAKGSFLHAAVTHRNSSVEDPAQNISEIVSQNPDFIWAAYSGKEAVSFFNAYNSLELKEKFPVITMAPAVSENVRQSAKESLENVWYMNGEDYENNENPIIKNLTVAIGRKPNPYALLAYESIQLIADAMNNAEDVQSFIQALSQAQFESFRGKVRFNDDLGADVQFVLRQIKADGETTEKFSAPPLLHEQYRLACQKLTKQGWVNPYLCA